MRGQSPNVNNPTAYEVDIPVSKNLLAKAEVWLYKGSRLAAGLTKEQLEKFERDGLLVIEDFLSIEEVDSLKSEITKLVENMDPETDRGVFSTKDNNNKQVRLTKGEIR